MTCRSVFLLALVFCMLAGCNRAPSSGPPQVRFGKDECAECKMGVVDDRAACAIRTLGPDEPTVLVFDDIGCMLDYERLNPDVRIVERYVTDFKTRRLIPAESAAYLFGAAVQTPMGSATVAFSDAAGAGEEKKSVGGELVSFDELKNRRQKVMEERYGKPAR